MYVQFSCWLAETFTLSGDTWLLSSV